MTTYAFLTYDHGPGAITQTGGGWAVCARSPVRGRKKWKVARPRHLGGLGCPDELLCETAPEAHDAVRAVYAEAIEVRPGTFAPARLSPGQYHPRIWGGWHDRRQLLGGYSPFDAETQYGSAFNQSMVAARNLFDDLEALFKVIEPVRANEKAHGHRLRDLLILCCTEIEANWRAVWLDNTAQAPPKRLTTAHYVRLVEPMALADWAVDLVHYQDFADLSPFGAWTSEEPTQSLPWYEAYNAVKHDRAELHQATLCHVVQAVAALHILLCAQWGPEHFDPWGGGYRSPLRLAKEPKRSCGDCYFPPLDCDDNQDDWRPVKCL